MPNKRDVFSISNDDMSTILSCTDKEILGEEEKKALKSILDGLPEWTTVIITQGEHMGVVGEDVGDLGDDLINVETRNGKIDGCVGVHKDSLINIFGFKQKAGMIEN